MLQRLHGAPAEIGSGSGAAERAREGDLLGGEEVHTVGGRIDFELMRFFPADVDEQVGVRGARFNHDRAQMPMIDSV